MNQLMQPPDFWTINSIGSFRKFIAEILAEISWSGCQDMNFAADSRWKLTLCVPLVQVEAFRSNKFIQTYWYDNIDAIPVFYWWLQYLYFQPSPPHQKHVTSAIGNSAMITGSSGLLVNEFFGLLAVPSNAEGTRQKHGSSHHDFISSFALKPTICSTSVVSI